MAIIEIAKIQIRRGQENQTGVPLLAGGEFAWAADTENLYIGLKREDGGSRDANVRILTENDIRLFNSFVQTAALATTYTWEVDKADNITVNWTTSTAVSRTVQDKLDDFVSVLDFGISTASGYDCSIQLQSAIDHLFLDFDVVDGSTTYDPGKTNKFNKKLYFPAGIYNVGQTIFIPKETVLVGEGVDKTIIRNISTGSGLFQTVDYYGRRSESGNPDSNIHLGKFIGNTVTSVITINGSSQPNNIHIEGMTLSYNTSTPPHQSLISLDCVNNALIRNIKFEGIQDRDQGPTGAGGIDIRGYANGGITSENILIDKCSFNGLYYGIHSNWDVNHVTIQNSEFTSSTHGVAFNTSTNLLADTGPIYSQIQNNKFKNIFKEAIYVGAKSSTTASNVVSINNAFIDVGNYGRSTEAWTSGTAVITFGSKGNISINDYFYREIWHNQRLNADHTYYPLISGNATIDRNNVVAVTLTSSAETDILRLPITTSAQYLILKYNIDDPLTNNISKVGHLHVYIRKGANPTVRIFDDYNTAVSDGGIYWGVKVDDVYRYYQLIGVNPGTASVNMEYQLKLVL